MTNDLSQGNMIVPLRNVMALMTLVQRVTDRDPRLPGLAVFFGYSGFGKSTALAYAANNFDAAHVEVRSTWTRQDFCEAILAELDIPAPKRLSQMVDLIGKQLGQTGQPLFIDEADYLVERNLLKIVRDIHDIAHANAFRGPGANIIMVGEENLPVQFSRVERFHGRIFDAIPAAQAAIEDVDLLAPRYARNIEIDPELKEFLLLESRFSIRRVCSNLAKVLECAHWSGASDVTRENWEAFSQATGVEFSTGKPPRPRGLL